jgi:hypothetical protein
MASGSDVLTMLIPNGGWVIYGDEYAGINFISCDAISEAEFKAGFAKADQWFADQAKAKADAKAALLVKLGITADEAALLLA